nr:hypothetical protein [Tanacetum cinerariifolium]
AFRVFNGKTRIVKENLHIRFSESTPNVVDHLGKFDGKADEGFFIGYFLNSRAFRVFNSRTRIVKENLHIRFSESTPNVVGSGLNWLFDIDALTRTMNYESFFVYFSCKKEDNVNNTNNVNAAGTNDDNELPFGPTCLLWKMLTYSTFQIMVKMMEEPKKVIHALKDPSWIEAMQKELLSMIGSLMYLTSSRPDIMFAVCACATYQVNPKISHLHAVKRIFRYLKGQLKLGLWYLKDSPFNLVAYTDSDYARASLDKKSTTGEAEYVAASSCCGQVL